MTLKTDIEADIAKTFYSSIEFADDATYTPAGGSPKPIKIIFDDEYDDGTAEFIRIDNSRIQARVIGSDVAGIKQGDTILLNSITYFVVGVQPTTFQETILILSSIKE